MTDQALAAVLERAEEPLPAAEARRFEQDVFETSHVGIERQLAAFSGRAVTAMPRSVNYEPQQPYSLNNVIGRLKHVLGRLDHLGLEICDTADFLCGTLPKPPPGEHVRPGEGALVQFQFLADRLERATDRLECEASRISGGVKQPGETLTVFD